MATDPYNELDNEQDAWRRTQYYGGFTPEELLALIPEPEAPGDMPVAPVYGGYVDDLAYQYQANPIIGLALEMVQDGADPVSAANTVWADLIANKVINESGDIIDPEHKMASHIPMAMRQGVSGRDELKPSASQISEILTDVVGGLNREQNERAVFEQDDMARYQQELAAYERAQAEYDAFHHPSSAYEQEGSPDLQAMLDRIAEERAASGSRYGTDYLAPTRLHSAGVTLDDGSTSRPGNQTMSRDNYRALVEARIAGPDPEIAAGRRPGLVPADDVEIPGQWSAIPPQLGDGFGAKWEQGPSTTQAQPGVMRMDPSIGQMARPATPEEGPSDRDRIINNPQMQNYMDRKADLPYHLQSLMDAVAQRRIEDLQNTYIPSGREQNIEAQRQFAAQMVGDTPVPPQVAAVLSAPAFGGRNVSSAPAEVYRATSDPAKRTVRSGPSSREQIEAMRRAARR